MEGEYAGIDTIRATINGISDAQLYIKLTYMDGVSVWQDYLEAARYFHLAANRDNQELRTSSRIFSRRFWASRKTRRSP